MKKWKVQIKGGYTEDCWEISVVHIDNDLGQNSLGWFDNDEKYLISSNDGEHELCYRPVCRFVFDECVKIANKLCRKLNKGECVN